MLNEQKKQTLDNFLAVLSKEQIIWVSGYITGKTDILSSPSVQVSLSVSKITIIYATETGNSKKVAIVLGEKLKKLGVKVNIKAIEHYNTSKFSTEEYIVFVVATHGEGELPEPTKGFWEYLDKETPDLSKMQYAILSLGDSNYPLFCEAGNILHNKLTDLGAQKWIDTVEFDLDFDDHINDWYITVESAVGQSTQNNNAVSNPIKRKSKPNYTGEIISNIILNDEGSNKEVHHIEIETDAEYLPGDSIGIKIDNNTPRLYSISSSPEAHTGEIHVTVKKMENGLCSPYLADLKEGSTMEFYISPNNIFRMPNDDKDIIMVGSGTGVAPFRSFLAERDSIGASGKNWLFFGEQYARHDFLYQIELQDYLQSGVLTHLSLAFSRDQEEKIYVQHRINEEKKELKNWLDNGAYFYICGDKEGMAKEVEKILIEMLGEEYFNSLVEEGRYLKDVY
ncbi:MAG: sulfite reductase alpha subunit-like flavoprotein [Candidatus Deianiraeaceae bacterium]|jgi:sulfite reductase alpha subunit-like flavoprotein